MIDITLRPNPLPKFKILYNLPPKTWLVINIGGRGGGKSYEVSKWALLQALSKNKRIALLRDEQSTIAQSIMHEIKMRYAEVNLKANLLFNTAWEMQDNGLKSTPSSMMHIFSKGFRSARTSQKAGLKSIADVDVAVVEEFEDIADEEKFNVFADTIRKEGAVIVINSNVPSKNHWFVKRYFNLVDAELVHEDEQYKGWYILEPKTIPGVVYIISDYHDNPHLSSNTISRYEAYGDPSSNLYNLEHYLSDIKGYVSEGAKGRIYRRWKAITNSLFNQTPYPSYYGLDFGYSDDPVALVEIKTHNNRNWWRETIYEVGLTNPALAKLMIIKGVSKRAPIYADSAEPKSIQELRNLGFNVIPADKGPDSVLYGIKTLKAMENYITEESLNLWHENQEYKWALDANKEPTDTPEDKNDHGLSAGRYAITTHKHANKGFVVADTSEFSVLDWIDEN